MPTTLTPPAPTPYAQFRSRRSAYYARGAAVLPATEFYGKTNPRRTARLVSGEERGTLDAFSVDHGPGLMVLDKNRNGNGSRLLPFDGADCVGDSILLKHDQTGATLGRYFVVGIVEPDGAIIGHVPNRLLPVAVFK